MSRPRKHGNSSLPDNLYRKFDQRTVKVYYTYRNPQSGMSHGLGTDHESAVNDARALNAAIYASIRSATLAAIVAPKADTPNFGKVLKRHLELCEKRDLAKNTMRGKVGLGRIWEAALGADTLIGSITVRNVVEVLATYEDRPRMASAMRSAAIDIWKDAIQEGWANENVADKTRSSPVKVKRSRLTLEDYQRIYKAALGLPDAWIALSIQLALVTAQRREDVACMEFRKTKDSSAWVEGDALCIIQKKTGTKVRIPLDIGINEWTIGGLVKTSRRDNILTRWLVHHVRHHGTSKPSDQVWVDTISKGFARARDLAGVTGEEGKTPPTFHEIRSLSIRLYAEKYGKEFAQAIAGHKSAEMTAIYRDVRGAEWVQVKAG